MAKRKFNKYLFIETDNDGKLLKRVVYLKRGDIRINEKLLDSNIQYILYTKRKIITDKQGRYSNIYIISEADKVNKSHFELSDEKLETLLKFKKMIEKNYNGISPTIKAFYFKHLYF